ncbi:Hsp20/alpha crystallin family protein [Roseivirga sp. UBA1976]|uniref:Hsp20/alpha crystallin family protein n=1 Tax=Roseivirga sp. UBA1976 TaxID=1947386 RepID=UPI000ED31A70|nr:Hsp20/alpha crystallin family protein [Roseivirga sp. UBA1976]HCQ17474.1 heat-shock protein [Cryomorphaceae bacterium]|tara:strand:- start:211 stop:648 length:438 start_codon:yes stop_codon:yes gene_type:complete
MALVRTSNPSFSSLFDDFFNTELGDWRRQNYSSTDTTLPKVNIKENDDAFMVEMAAPGMKKEDFNIQLDNNLLTISSEKKEDSKDDNFRYSRKEFAYRSFQRAFTIPESADEQKIGAVYEDGILTITIPKKEEAKPQPPKTISIK